MQIAVHANSEAELKGTFDMMQFKLGSIQVLAKMRNERRTYDLPGLRYTAAPGETLKGLLKALNADLYFLFIKGSEDSFHKANPFSLEEDLGGKTVVLPFWMVCTRSSSLSEDIGMELEEFRTKLKRCRRELNRHSNCQVVKVISSPNGSFPLLDEIDTIDLKSESDPDLADAIKSWEFFFANSEFITAVDSGKIAIP